MSEPNEFPPPPFTPAPLELKERSGCRKVLLFGCGGLFLILALGLVGMIAKAPELMRALLVYLEDDTMAKIAPAVPAAERERLHQAFVAARAHPMRVEDPEGLKALQSKVLELNAKTELSREDVAGLTAALERFAAVAPKSIPSPAPGAGAPNPPPGPTTPQATPAPPGGPAPAPRASATA